MIQDIYPHQLNISFRMGLRPQDGDLLFLFDKERVLCRLETDIVIVPQVGECVGWESARYELRYLFKLDAVSCWLGLPDECGLSGIGADEHRIVVSGYEYQSIRALRRSGAARRELIFAAVTARHLNDWYQSARFCGGCGHVLKPSETERAMVCPACGRIFYPRINPAVIIGVTNRDQLLLTKYAGRDIPFYALVAGFAEIGESFEDTVRREVREETGLEVTNIRYYKSQPWGFAADILAGYYCDVVGDPMIHMDENELKEAVWMTRREIIGQPDDFSLTNEMMCAFRDGLAV